MDGLVQEGTVTGATDATMAIVGVVTATLDKEKTRPHWSTWGLDENAPKFVIVEGVMGVVPAFLHGIRRLISQPVDWIACLHDDLEFLEEIQLGAFPRGGKNKLVCSYSGATGLGDPDIFQTPYSPMQLARRDFLSNMKDAEVHGRRAEHVERVVCADGFSLIGPAAFMLDAFSLMDSLGIVHHAYDSFFGALARLCNLAYYFIPARVHHHGGVTAVGSEKYHAWAREQQGEKGDAGFWEDSHRIVYDFCKHLRLLPLSVNDHFNPEPYYPGKLTQRIMERASGRD